MSILQIARCLSKWAAATQRGNAAFEDHNLAAARDHFEQAFELSESLLSEPPVPNAMGPTPATAFHISALNLFSCQEALGDCEMAFSYLAYCVYRLWQASQNSNLESLHQLRIHLTWQRAVTMLYNTCEAAGRKVEVDFWATETYENIARAKTVAGICPLNFN